MDVRGEYIAAAADCLDQIGYVRIDLDLAAQPADLDVDATVEQHAGPAAGQVQQLVTAEHALRMLDKGQQQIEFARGQRQQGAVRRSQLPLEIGRAHV